MTDLNLANAKTLDDAAVDACSAAIEEALKKYNCFVVFEQTYRNGVPGDMGQFRVLKKPANKPEIIQ